MPTAAWVSSKLASVFAWQRCDITRTKTKSQQLCRCHRFFPRRFGLAPTVDLAIALPSILGNLSYTIVGMVQTKFVGELGAQALAALGAGQRIFFAMQAILMAISAGTTALVARAWGAGDYDEASRVHGLLGISGGFSFAIAFLGFLRRRWRRYLVWIRLPWTLPRKIFAGCRSLIWHSPRCLY